MNESPNNFFTDNNRIWRAINHKCFVHQFLFVQNHLFYDGIRITSFAEDKNDKKNNAIIDKHRKILVSTEQIAQKINDETDIHNIFLNIISEFDLINARRYSGDPIYLDGGAKTISGHEVEKAMKSWYKSSFLHTLNKNAKLLLEDLFLLDIICPLLPSMTYIHKLMWNILRVRAGLTMAFIRRDSYERYCKDRNILSRQSLLKINQPR